MTIDAVGPPLASDISVCLSSARISDSSALRSARGSSAPSTRRFRNEFAYPAVAQWEFLTSTPQHLDSQRRHRPVQPARPATARDSVVSESAKLPRRPATSRGTKSRSSHQKQMELLTPRIATVALQEAIRRERDQEQYVDPLLGRSVEPRSQPAGRECKPKSGGAETNTIALLSRPRGDTTASFNATERLRMRAFQARANGEYDRAIKFYTSLSTTKPKEVEAHFHLAVCLERTGQLASALAAYKQVQKLSGGHHAFAYYNMGNLSMRADRVAQAIDYFTRAITTSKRHGCNYGNSQNSKIGPTPVIFYRQRAAAYRKNGDFEKAAQDYVLVERCAGATSSVEENTSYSAQHLYQPVSHPKKTTRQKEHDPGDSEIGDSLGNEDSSNQEDTNQPQMEMEVAEDALTAWALHHSLAIARLRPSDRTDSDLQHLVDFMQKRFSVCATLHHDVCKLLCRELLLSPEGALPARTPIFIEHDESSAEISHDRALYFVLQGRVSIYKTAGRMFKSSPQKQRQQELLQTHEPRDDDSRDEQEEEMWQCPWASQPPPVSNEWKQSQLELCDLDPGDVFGHQGKFADTPREYSAVTTTTCAIGAISWSHWCQIDRAQREAEQERAARFLTMTPVFNGIHATDIRNLASRATFVKVVGSKALCCEGQFVDGLLIIREGEVCQFSPCGLKTPPDLSVGFDLSGTLTVPQSGRTFFVQLELAGDPLRFLRVNEAFHGFLPQNYVSRKQRELSRLASARLRGNSRASSAGTDKCAITSEPLAVSLRRGDCFCASSSWIPPRQSRPENQGPIQGAACSKTALVSVSTAEFLFLASTDLAQGLSLDSRAQLHRNLQDISNQRKSRVETAVGARSRGPLPGKRSSNMLEQFARDATWSKFKEDLVESVLRGRSPHFAAAAQLM